MLLISIFHQAIDDAFLVLSDQIFFLQTVSFSEDKLLLQCLVLIDGISGCLWLLGTRAILQRGQLQFSGMFLV